MRTGLSPAQNFIIVQINSLFSLCVYINIGSNSVCIYIYIPTPRHPYTYVCVHVYICVYHHLYIHIYVCAQVCIYIYMHACCIILRSLGKTIILTKHHIKILVILFGTENKRIGKLMPKSTY